MSGSAPQWHLHQPPPELVAGWLEAGLWRDDPLPLGQFADDSLRRFADRAFTFRSEVRPWKGTYREIRQLALRAAEGLARRGISSGDIVAFQLPNWVEAAVTFYAVTYLGAVIVPIVHTYGPKEVAYILRRSDVRLFVTAKQFGRTDYLAHLDEIRADLPRLDSIIVVGDGPLPAGTESFDALLDAPALGRPTWGDPRQPVVIAYTSGTTADPKGVIHSDVTLMAEMHHQAAMRGAGGRTDGASLVGAPLGHAGGMYASLLTPLLTGTPIHLIDKWDPAVVLSGMLEDGLSSGSGVTFFLTSLLDHPDCTPAHHVLIGAAGMGGAAVPPAVSDRAEQLGITLFRSYGSTEHPSITGSWGPATPAAKRKYTDGRPLPGVEVRLVDEDGRDVEPGTPGEILSRGPDMFLGYTDAALTREAIDPDGWFATGDIGQADEDGYITIVDRKKDIIIRGGENVSALEVEELLLRMPGVLDVAVVAAPDPRLGEHGCAFVQLETGLELDLPALQSHLEASGLGRQKWPEELRLVGDLPRTPSGKVRKADLRRQLREEAEGS